MKILVVDDEMDVETLFKQRFRKEINNNEFEFEFAFSAENAIAFMNQHQHEAVLILSDINMPGMSGLLLLKHIKENFKNPSPIVMMLTAYGDAENYDEAMKLGADDFLTKPVDFVKLKEKFKNFIL